MAWRRKQPGKGVEDFGPIAAVIAAGVVLSVMLFFVARGYFFAADRDQFQRDAAFYGATFRSSMERHVNSLAAIHAFVTASHDVNRWEFSNFAHQILPQNSGFKAVLWLPDISARERPGFEAELQRDGLFGLTLREVTDTGQLVSAGAREDYVPVAYVEPFEASGNLIGVDLAHNPIYAPLFEAARKTDKVVASAPLDRALVDGKPPLVVLVFPLNRHTVAEAVGRGTVSAGKIGLARAASPNNLEGYALGVVQLDRVVETAIGPRAPVQAVIAYGDKNAPALFGANQTLARWLGAREFHQLEPFRIAGKPFFLAIRPAQGDGALTRFYLPAGAALFGLLLTALLTQSMLATTMRKRQVERAVVARTAELRSSNQSLNAEIAQRREAEAALIAARDKAEAANRAKSAFLSTMSHELRTPLNAIIGFSGMLLSDAAAQIQNHKTADYLSEINGAGTRLLNLINDILEITQMDTEAEGADDLVSLSDIIESVMEKMRDAADQAGVALQASVSERLPALTGDARRLKRALEHLVGNAIKFGARGGFAVIGARLSDDGLILEVRDNGAGLKPGTEEAAMKLFAQADSSLTRRHGGVGLGLTFVARVAHQHGAALKIQSKPGEGTRVALVFPEARIAQAHNDQRREVA